MIELNGIQLDKTSAVPLYEQLRKIGRAHV